jgi:hypothetical protein
VLCGCSSAASDETPSGALRLFLDAMERGNREPAALEEAYHLLATPSRRALQRRAHDANADAARVRGTGENWRGFEAGEMLVPGRFRMNFTPARGGSGMQERITGERAIVHVTSQDRRRQADVSLVREQGHWRVLLEIPDRREVTPSDSPP